VGQAAQVALVDSDRVGARQQDLQRPLERLLGHGPHFVDRLQPRADDRVPARRNRRQPRRHLVEGARLAFRVALGDDEREARREAVQEHLAAEVVLDRSKTVLPKIVRAGSLTSIVSVLVERVMGLPS